MLKLAIWKKISSYSDLLFFGSILVVLFFVPFLKTSWDNIPAALTPLSIIREKNLDFDEFEEGQLKLNGNEEIYYFSINSQGKTVANFPIANGILITPFFFIATLFDSRLLEIYSFQSDLLQNFIFHISTFITIFNSFLIYLLIKKKTNQLIAYFSVLLFIFCTPVVAITSRFLYQHTFGLLFFTFLLLAYEYKKTSLLILFSVLAFVCRPPTILLTLPFIIYSFFKSIKIQKSKDDYVWYSISTIILFLQGIYALSYLDGYNLFALQYGANRFVGSILPGIAGLLFSPSRGLLFHSSFFLISLIYIVKEMRKKSIDYWLYFIALFTFIIVNSLWDMWYGGWTVSYRLLIDCIPILIMSMAAYLKEELYKTKNYLRIIVVGSFIMLSFFIHTYYLARLGDCDFNAYPENIDALSSTAQMERLWLDSPIFRCFNQG